jgi:hypothetical protein
LELADRMEDPEEAQAERDDVQPQLVRAGRAIQELEQFLVDVKRAGGDSKNRIVGHIVLSPPLIFSAGDDGFTQDFTAGVCQHLSSKISTRCYTMQRYTKTITIARATKKTDSLEGRVLVLFLDSISVTT